MVRVVISVRVVINVRVWVRVEIWVRVRINLKFNPYFYSMSNPNPNLNPTLA